MRKWTVYIVIAALIFSMSGWLIMQRKSASSARSDQPTETAIVQRGDMAVTIEATGSLLPPSEIMLAFPSGGIVAEVLVAKETMVTAGDLLVRMDDAAQSLQLEQAELNLQSLTSPYAIAEAEKALADAEKALQDLHTKADNDKIQALQAIENYAKAVKDAQYQLDNYTVPSNQAGMETIEALDLMKEKLDQAREAFEPYKYYPSGSSIRDEFKNALDIAQSDYNAAVRRVELEYELEVAQYNMEKARADYEQWKDGPDQADVIAAEARVSAAKALLDELKGKTVPQDETLYLGPALTQLREVKNFS